MDKKGLKILITGGNGFLGSAIVHKLLPKHKIIVLERSLTKLHRLKDVADKIKVYESTPNSILQVFKSRDIDLVIHTATLYGKKETPVSDILYSNVFMPLQVIEAGIDAGIKAFINTDSFFNQGSLDYKYLGNYTLSKKHINDWLQLLSDQLPIFNMKLQHMYGPGDNTDKFVMQMALSLSANCGEINLTPGEQIRDFIFIDDVVQAYITIIEQLEDFENGFHQFNVGTGHGVTIRQFAEKMKTLSNASTKLNFGVLSYRANEIMNSIADISALEILGWKPETELTTGIDKIFKTL